MSNIEEYTKNFKFIIPEFNVATWHTEIKENFKAIDALIANFVQSQQYKGAWKQVTQYEIGDLVYISDENSNNYGGLFKVLVNHITTGDDFDTFLGNNPTYYDLQGEMGAQVAALRAQDWAEKTDGIVVINESPVDYSSKAYAIGGVGTETNNSKYFKEQAELARDGILLDPGFIAVKNDMLGDENIKTVAENISNINAVNANKTNINAVNANKTNIDAVASNQTNINNVANNASNINSVAGNTTNINAVAGNMSDVNNCATNINAILNAPNQAQNAANSATSAANSAQLAQEAALSVTNGWDLFDHKWEDHLLNDQNWLRADTFSWHPATTQHGTYLEAYNHLVDDVDGKTASNSDTIGSYTIYYVLADDGHKIVGPDQEATVNNIYNESGVAWYYVLDKTNQRFKLPRTKYGFTGLRDEVGKYVAESLPNIKGKTAFGVNNALGQTISPVGSYTSGAFKRESLGFSVTRAGGGSASSSSEAYLVLDASNYSSTYQDNAPVQQRATQMYLYFYVGQFSQSATEQTAGLNSELFNGKVDLNAANLSTAGKSLISGLGMPSDVNEDLTLSASDSEYTAPANGFYYICKGASSGQYIQITNTTASYKKAMISSNNNQCIVSMGVKKDDVVKIKYTAAGTLEAFKFIYAEGEI